ncbi:ArsR family transcriptional regulator [Ensifer adhaerens]|uniref:ArsR family transcriptional regulator n=1 Tax=Ensifer adhaerens TaxID=106592 RepID=A0A0L8BRN5_ENSAD|nr:metalloregulator ArsR/SmtB family transcription factor [Ensifer adhaerens]KOF17174.1 ArsR family transcriptional regulator [Ensifer adhaerens]
MTYDYSGIVALSDPTRRAIFELVAGQPRSVAELTRALPVSQSAVSQHLKVLKDARLVSSESKGTRNIYQIDPHGLAQMRAWLDTLWVDALDSFKSAVEQKEE